MTAIGTPGARGRILSSKQVRFSDAPVRLESQARCPQSEASVSLKTDPITGDALAIVVRCGCGEVTVVECNYDGRLNGSV